MDHPKVSLDGSGILRLGFGDYGQDVEVAAISSDGARVLTVREVGIARIYDIESGKLLATLEPTSPLTGSDAAPSSAPFSVFIESADLNPDGSVAVLGLNDGSCHLYDVGAGTLIARLKEPIDLLPRNELRRLLAEGPLDKWELVRCVAVSPDGRLLAIGHFKSAVSVWHMANQELCAYFRPLEKHAATGESMPRSGFVTSISFSRDSHFLFAGTSDGAAFIWDIINETMVFSATRHTSKTLAISINKDELSWVNSNGEICCSVPGRQSEVINHFPSDWYSAAFSPDGKSVMTWGPEREVQRVDLVRREIETLASVQGHWRDNLVPFGFGTNEKECYFLSSPNAMTQLGSHRVIDLNSRFDKFISSPDRTLLAVKTWGSAVRVYRSSDGELIGIFDSGTGTGSVAFSHDNKRILIGELGNGGGLYDRHAFLYDIESGGLLTKFVADQFQILGVAFGIDSKRFVTKSKSISVWEYKDENIRLINRQQIENHSNEFHVFSDGRMIVFQTQKAILFDEFGNAVSSFAFSLRFREVIGFDEARDRMVCGRSHQQLEVWNFAEGRMLRQLETDIPTPNRIPTPELHQEHRFRAGASIWQCEYGNFLHQGDGPRGWITPLRTSDCGDFVVLPTETRGLLIQVSTDRVIGEIPFRGRLCASRCTESSMVMLNSEGEVFRATFSC